MRTERIFNWLDDKLQVKAFSDVSNNGVQIARVGATVKKVAFAVDGSLDSVMAAVEARAQVLVVHHGISWGGGMERLTGALHEIVRTAIRADMALYAAHLPLDAHPRYGNNAGLARFLGVFHTRKAFSYHGSEIGLIGDTTTNFLNESTLPSFPGLSDRSTLTVGICSGGGGAFAPEAAALGCDLFVTGEADWGETIAAENAGMPILCLGHYASETFGVKALSKAMARQLKVETCYLPRPDERRLMKSLLSPLRVRFK